ncbi:MAG: LPS export ABC transporter permease LptF [SAR324 cluster bacterium]|nr:LPS export ABC transporter permease LptF [SAR324 cluster bacterium]
MIFFRYIFVQLLVPYFLGVTILTFVLSLDTIYRLVNLLITKGGGSSIVFLILYRMPQFLASTLPLGVVIAVIVVMARLSLDLEIVAMRAAGFGVKTLIFPVLAFAFVVTLTTYFMTLWAQPTGYAAFEAEKFRLLKSQASKQIQPKVINQDFSGKILYVDAKEENEQLLGVFIADQEIKEQSMVIMANRGKFNLNESDQEMKLELSDGAIHLTAEEPEIYRTIDFKTLNYVFQESGVPQESSAIWGIPTMELTSVDRKSALMELLLRLTSPLAALVLALAAIPLGVTDPRSGRTGSYLRAVILVIAYYILWMGAKNMTFKELVSPHILWWPPFIILLYGLYTLYKMDYNLKSFATVFRHLWSKKILSQ